MRPYSAGREKVFNDAACRRGLRIGVLLQCLRFSRAGGYRFGVPASVRGLMVVGVTSGFRAS